MVTPKISEERVSRESVAFRKVLANELKRGKVDPKLCDSRCGQVTIPVKSWRALMEMFGNLEEIAGLRPTGASESGTRNGKR